MFCVLLGVFTSALISYGKRKFFFLPRLIEFIQAQKKQFFAIFSILVQWIDKTLLCVLRRGEYGSFGAFGFAFGAVDSSNSKNRDLENSWQFCHGSYRSSESTETCKPCLVSLEKVWTRPESGALDCQTRLSWLNMSKYVKFQRFLKIVNFLETQASEWSRKLCTLVFDCNKWICMPICMPIAKIWVKFVIFHSEWKDFFSSHIYF